MKLLVTGGAGFIGSAVVRQAIRDGHEVVNLDALTYAACLDKAMLAEMPDRDQMVRDGDFAPILDWMRRKIHRHGSLYAPRDLIERATGAPPDGQALIAYLRGKFLG